MSHFKDISDVYAIFACMAIDALRWKWFSANHYRYLSVLFLSFLASFRRGMGCCCGKLEEKVNEMFEQNQIIAKETFWVNLVYQKSIGLCQIKGNGALVLT